MSRPVVGSFVQVRGLLGVHNGAETVSAVVTRVWSSMQLGAHLVWLVNLHVFHDGPETVWRPHVYLFPDEQAARAVPGFNAWWPPSG
ncbi:hypothetical protein [Nonomuraea sp. NPDC049504]|uniref:hypothetical protein n=1 Tax=Nonomuraea sp. NPDC049504 TaxID=3154729 RepID=UPI0034366304